MINVRVLKDSSIGLRSGEYGGKYMRMQSVIEISVKN
jgi:hypothetical protein